MSVEECFPKSDGANDVSVQNEILLEIVQKLSIIETSLEYNIPERIVESGRKVEENILSSADKTEALVLTSFRKLNKSLQQFNEKKDSFASNLSRGHYLSCICCIIEMFIYIILWSFYLSYFIIKMGTRYFGLLGGVLVTGLILWLIASLVSILTYKMVSTDQILTFGINLIVSILWSLCYCLSPFREVIFKDWKTAFLNSHIRDPMSSLVTLPSKITGLVASNIGSQLITNSTFSVGNWFPSTFNLNTTKIYESFKINDWYTTSLNLNSFKIYDSFGVFNWTLGISNLSSFSKHLENYSYFSYFKNKSGISWS